MASALAGTGCGGKTALAIIGGSGGELGDDASADASDRAQSTADALSTGGFSGTDEGAGSGASGGTDHVGRSGPTGAAGAGAGGKTVDGKGDAPEIEGTFYFLGTTEPAPEPVVFSYEPSTLYQYRQGDELAVLVPPFADRLYFAQAPVPPSDQFLLGIEVWVEGSVQLIYSFDVGADALFSHGQWGGAPWGSWDSEVRAAARLTDEVVVVLRWLFRAARSQIWLVDTTDTNSSDSAREGDELLGEYPDVELGFHGVTAENRAVFSDKKNLLFLEASGNLEQIQGPDDALERVTLSHSGSAALTVSRLGEVSTLRVIERDWSQPRIEAALVPESVTWSFEQSVLYEADEEVFLWNPLGDADPELVTPRFSGYRPRGRSVSGDFGAALSVQSEGGWGIAFVDRENVAICGPVDSPIRALEPHVRDGTSGVLFDEFDPENPLVFGTIHFCAPGRSPIDVLADRQLLGRLLSD